MSAPPLRYRTDSLGRSRPLCQDVRRHAFGGYQRAGDPCQRYASGRSNGGLGHLVCASHADKPAGCWRAHRILGALRRGVELQPVTLAKLAKECGCTRCATEAPAHTIEEADAAEHAARDAALAKATRCPSCGCTALFPCTVSLPGDGGTGHCAHARLEPWLTSCSACMTPELRGRRGGAAAKRGEADSARARRSGLRNTVGNGDTLVTAEVGMCFRVYFTYGERLVTARRRGDAQDRRFTRRRYAHLFALDVRRQKGEAEIRYEASRRFEPNDVPAERAWVPGAVVPG